jgi:hypothetical protein
MTYALGAVLCGLIGYAVGQSKGKAAEGLLLGLILGPLGWLVLILLYPGTGLKCPHCGGSVEAGYGVCRHCAREFEPFPIPEAPAVPRGPDIRLSVGSPNWRKVGLVLAMASAAIAVSALGLWGIFRVTSSTSTESPVVAADECTAVAVRRDLQAFNQYLGRWKDGLTLARSTPRMALPGQIAELQKLRQEIGPVSTLQCTRPIVDKEYLAESKELEGLTKFLDPDFGSLLSPASFEEADKLRLAVYTAGHDLRSRFWPDQVRYEDAEQAADQRRKQEAIDKAAALKREADLQAQQVRVAAEEAARAEQAKVMAAGQEQARKNHEQWVAERQAKLAAATAAELADWKARASLPGLSEKLGVVASGLLGEDVHAQIKACYDLRTAYSAYVAKVVSLPPPPAELLAKRMDETIRDASARCDRGDFQDARLQLQDARRQAGDLAKALE